MSKKSYLLTLILVLLISAAGCIIYVPYDDQGGNRRPGRTYDQEPYQEYGDYDTSYFYEYLSPHGTWVSLRQHGYVWIPRNMSYRWRPYTNGRWIWTDYGWTWVSNFDWGWVPFHYGRWGWDNDFGWYWVPGTVWGPAWVAWRWGDNYLGWAPLPPDVEFISGVGIHGLPYDLPSHYWTFLEGRHFQDFSFDRYILPYERNLTIINVTQLKADINVRNRRVVNDGIDIEQIRKVTLRDVQRIDVQDADRPGRDRLQGGELQIFRPAVTKNDSAKPKKSVEESEARGRASSIRSREPGDELDPAEAESRIRREQEREVRLLEETQEKDTTGLKRELEGERAKVKTAAEKENVEKEYRIKSENLKKQHDDEKSGLTKRHQEEEKALKGKIKKKDK